MKLPIEYFNGRSRVTIDENGTKVVYGDLSKSDFPEVTFVVRWIKFPAKTGEFCLGTRVGVWGGVLGAILQ